MLIARKLIHYILFAQIVVLMLVCSSTVLKAVGVSSCDYEIPLYKIHISENTQRDIWELYENNHLSYELVLAIFLTEGKNDIQIDSIKAEIEELAYFRDYWTEQGYPDEYVFDLLLLSRQRGIEGCIMFMKNTDPDERDEYVEKVTECKYFLEKNDSSKITDYIRV